MENRKLPALIAVAGVVIAVAVWLFVANDDTADQESETTQQVETAPPPGNEGEGQKKQDDKPEEPQEPAVPQIEMQGGEPVGGAQEIEVAEGDELRIEVITDTPDELHLHGFDLYFDIVPDKTNQVVVESADIGGVFELESHTTGALLAEISVVP
jgi:FtsP/CotA-like multicopper oxidase with cupredoxin domain